MTAKREIREQFVTVLIAAVITCAISSPIFAQSTTSEYAPLAEAPRPGERGTPPVISVAPPQAEIAPTPEPPKSEVNSVTAPGTLPVAPPLASESVAKPPSPPQTQSEASASATTVPAPHQPTAAELAAEEKKAAQEKAAKREKEARGERSASTGAVNDEKPLRGRIPEDGTLKNAAKLPPDDKGPRAISFISKCLDNYDNCQRFVGEQADRIPKGDICFPDGIDQVDITEKVRKFITLRPAIHDQAANRVVTEALYDIYPCKRAAPAHTAADKGSTPKRAKP
jgi:hypothetical protein